MAWITAAFLTGSRRRRRSGRRCAGGARPASTQRRPWPPGRRRTRSSLHAPWRRRTHLPSLRSMAGMTSMGCSGSVAPPVPGDEVGEQLQAGVTGFFRGGTARQKRYRATAQVKGGRTRRWRRPPARARAGRRSSCARNRSGCSAMPCPQRRAIAPAAPRSSPCAAPSAWPVVVFEIGPESAHRTGQHAEAGRTAALLAALDQPACRCRCQKGASPPPRSPPRASPRLSSACNRAWRPDAGEHHRRLARSARHRR
jgi:hypothetical protein